MSLSSSRVCAALSFALVASLVGVGCGAAGSDEPNGGPEVVVAREGGGAADGTDAAAAVIPPFDAGISVPEPTNPTSLTDASATASTCNAPIDIGNVTGDSANVVVAASGSGAGWVAFRLVELDHSVFAHKMKLRATLTPPMNCDLDLFVYVGQDVAGIECATATASGTTAGTGIESVATSWGETALANNGDDSRNVRIEVRPMAGTCTGEWTLSVAGNTD